jgi:hypothetical protein
MLKLIASLVMVASVAVAPVRAAERPDGTSDDAKRSVSLREAVTEAAAAAADPLPAWAVDRPQQRPAALQVLYGSYAALQVADIVSTRRALAAGATEANPLMKSAAGSSGAMLAVKAASAAGTIYLAERTWKKHRTGAIVLMAILNGVSAAVVAHNARHW